jgi:hypothetical protein
MQSLPVSANTTMTPAAQTVSATVGTAITSTTAYTTTGIAGTRVFAVSPSLPAGLSINTSTGVISGTPTASAVAATYTVTATDGTSSATATVTITVTGTATLSPSSQTVTGRVGAVITATTAFTTTGLTSPFYSIAPALPAGLSFNSSTGVLSGTPTAARTAATYVVTAADGTSFANATIRVTIAETPAMVPATQTISGTVGTAIAATGTFTASTVTGTKTFSISPALPAGLTLNSTTGVVTGTPTATQAQATHVITVTDGTNFATSNLVVTVVAAATTTTTVPVTTTTVPSALTGCPTPSIGGRVASTIDVPNSALPLPQFACSIKVGVRSNARAVVAIAHQGTTLNRTVASYSVVLSRIGGGSVTRTVTMSAAPAVLVANYGPLIRGSYTMTVVALSPTGTSVGTFTSAPFQI